MTDITEQELQSLRNLGNEYERAADEIVRLRAKLEWMPDGGPDGIDCRNETIKLQDENVKRLRIERDNARQLVSEGNASIVDLGDNVDELEAEIEHLRARVDELHSQPCSDCGAPSEPATLCSSCATSRCIELGIMAAAEQRKRDAEICRQIHSTSRQRIELALLCARTIEGASNDQ